MLAMAENRQVQHRRHYALHSGASITSSVLATMNRPGNSHCAAVDGHQHLGVYQQLVSIWSLYERSS